ncbi:Vacuolar protein sorting-associated protein 72-like [Oopsacas minuta]|uniref:Vacuolar protein sorting-associated protein 72 homolog n=1 Tax=Oopsacas minuta TaxID=111878 RepID=A0AAV7JTL7_9METZ|nr:Vacuolar protein sorting-associated protein 72-like [Oopsacas minuta]
MSGEVCSSDNERSEVRRSARSTAGNRLREMIRLELKRKNNERYLQDTFEGIQTGKEGMELLISDNNSISDIDDESEYSTEASSEDIVDSDFDDSVNEEGSDSGQEVELESQPKRKRIGKRILTRSTSHPTKLVTTTDSISEFIGSKKKSNKFKERSQFPSSISEGTRRSKRNSTRQSTEEARQKHLTETKDRHERFLKSAKNRKNTVKPLSQEELLKEAEETEKLNTDSLKSYLEMQIQRKKFVSRKKHAIHGPFIRYLSTSRAPNDSPRTRKQHALSGSTHVVNLIIHSHPEESPSVFRTYNTRKRNESLRSTCPISGLPARYRDPLTKLPYYNADAFKSIRAKYAQEQEERYLSRINTLKDILNGKDS